MPFVAAEVQGGLAAVLLGADSVALDAARAGTSGASALHPLRIPMAQGQAETRAHTRRLRCRMNALDLLLAASAIALALALRPWRAQTTLPWPALACWAAMPLLWSMDATTRMPFVQPLSGACLLVLMLGWPLTVLLLVPAALLMSALADLSLQDALHRGVWLALVPATLAMGLGAALRRWLPNHLFVYILGRGFFTTTLSLTGAGALSVWLHGVPVQLSADDVMLARGLTASGEAFITGMLCAIFVAFRPEWLATYTDRLYLPR